VQDEIAVLDHHIAKALVKVSDLRNLSNTQHFGEMIYFGAYSIVIVG